jgi:hypothetical protein
MAPWKKPSAPGTLASAQFQIKLLAQPDRPTTLHGPQSAISVQRDSGCSSLTTLQLCMLSVPYPISDTTWPRHDSGVSSVCADVCDGLRLRVDHNGRIYTTREIRIGTPSNVVRVKSENSSGNVDAKSRMTLMATASPRRKPLTPSDR